MFMHLIVVHYYFSAFCIDGIGEGGHGAWGYLVIELGYTPVHTNIIGFFNLLYRVLRLEAGLDIYHESQLSI